MPGQPQTTALKCGVMRAERRLWARNVQSWNPPFSFESRPKSHQNHRSRMFESKKQNLAEIHQDSGMFQKGLTETT